MRAIVAGDADLVGDMRTGVNASGSDPEGPASADLSPVMCTAAPEHFSQKTKNNPY